MDLATLFNARFEVFTTLKIPEVLFWAVTSCSDVVTPSYGSSRVIPNPKDQDLNFSVIG